MESMTGFSRQSSSSRGFSVNVQMKSLNARFLETKVGLPPDLMFLEEEVRRHIKAHFERGTVEVSIFCKKDQIDLPLKSLKKWVHEYKKNARILGVQDDLTMGKVLKKASNELKDSFTKEEQKLILTTVEKAIGLLKKRRRAEGRDLRSVLLKEIKAVRKELSSIKVFMKKYKKAIEQDWTNKILKLKGEIDTDTKVLDSELILLLEKSDITEEIDRIEVHLKEFLKIVSGKSDLVGKKLDFFCQELGREANTIASKSKSAELTRLSVNLKSYVEKLRQQVQNIQ